MATVHREPNQVKWVGVRPGHNGEQVLIDINSAVNAILYTVPANKLLFLYDWHTTIVRDVANTINIEIRNNVAAHQCYLAYLSSIGTEIGNTTSNALQVPIELAEAWDINLLTTVTCRGYLHGILIDA